MIYLVTGLGSIISAKDWFILVERSLNSIRKWWNTPITFMTLFHNWACLLRLATIVVPRVHSFVRLMITPSPEAWIAPSNYPYQTPASRA